MKNEADRKQRLKEAIREELATGEIPVPDEVLHALEKLFVTDAIDVLQAHPGYDLEDKIRSICTVVQLFDQAFTDLKSSLADFDEFSRQPEFNYSSHQERLVSIETRVRKEVFAFSELAHTLQDHCRRLRGQWNHPQIDSQILNSFGRDGLHDFLCGLRTALHHRSMIEADWLIRDAGSSETTHFVFRRRELMSAAEKWNARAEGYLRTCSEEIDIASLASIYHTRAHTFYDWLLSEVETAPPPEVADYRRCWKAHRVYSSRPHWRLFLSEFLRRGIDPYLYLDRYLTPDQIEEALQLPPHSREQADFIIRTVDKLSACDEEIAQLVYQLFGVTE